jgi:hypothetical protein
MTLCAPAAAQSPQVEYISEEPDLILSAAQTFGALGFDTSVRPPGRPALPIRIGDRVYRKGLGTHAVSEILIALEGDYLLFEADARVHWEEADAGSVVFQVFVDSVKRFDSGVMRKRDPARHIRVPVRGARLLRLVVTDAGDGITCDGANWAEARLTRDPARPRPSADAQPLDLAPFARVVASDPARREGTRAGRLEEFPAEDIFPEQEIAPRADGLYDAPASPGGERCIGLVWAERRVLTEAGVTFAAGSPLPAPRGARVEYWSSQGRSDDWSSIGQTPWQGAWAELPGALTANGNRWTYRIEDGVPEFRDRTGTLKLRWIFPPSPHPIRIQSLSAKGHSTTAVDTFRLEREHPAPGKPARIEVYNGFLLNGGAETTECAWNTGAPLTLTLRHTVRARNADRAILRIRLSDGAFGVPLADVLAQGCVYVRDFGLFVTRVPGGPTLAQYKRRIAGRRTVQERVRGLPDQTFARAKRNLLNPVQSNDPLLLSLACDNAKFMVDKTGVIHAQQPEPLDVSPRFGSGKNEGLRRRLYKGWLPSPIITVRDGGLVYRQQTCVVPMDVPTEELHGRPLCVSEYTIENPGDAPVRATLSLTFTGGASSAPLTSLASTPGAVQVRQGDRLAAVVRAWDGMALESQGSVVTLSADVPARGRLRCVLQMPGTRVPADEYPAFMQASDPRRALESYWAGKLAPAMRVETPEPMLNDLIRASQVHCLLAARSRNDGALVEPWCASMAYGALDTEAQPVILGMDALGHADFARRSLDYFLGLFRPDGVLTPSYTLVGTGQCLWTLGEHYRLTGDREWLRKAAPILERACRWIIAQRAKTKRLDARGQPVPEYGLMPPGVLADWNRYAFYFYANGYFYAGLRAAAQALADIRWSGAGELLKEAEAYRRDILRAYRWNQARMPAVPLSNGTWVPAYPSSLYCFGLTSDFYQGPSAFGHDVEVGGQHLLVHGVLPPDGPDARWMTDFMEDYWFLEYPGFYHYPIRERRDGWFDFGGFARMQPYYARNANISALRDDVRPFLRTYFNSFFPTLSADTLALWEHVSPVWGAWNKTHETGWFLWQTQAMLAQGYVAATVRPPSRKRPSAIVLRLRHPAGKKLRRVLVNGAPYADFDPEKEMVRLKPAGTPITVRAEY